MHQKPNIAAQNGIAVVVLVLLYFTIVNTSNVIPRSYIGLQQYISYYRCTTLTAWAAGSWVVSYCCDPYCMSRRHAVEWYLIATTLTAWAAGSWVVSYCYHPYCMSRRQLSGILLLRNLLHEPQAVEWYLIAATLTAWAAGSWVVSYCCDPSQPTTFIK